MALDDSVVAAGAMAKSTRRRSRFEFVPPRHFVLPAVLLLLSEEPSYGYRLVKDLKDLDFGRIDRPVVYRALGQLEDDGLVESWTDATMVGRPRRVYALTPLGTRVLRSWMGVVEQQRDALDGVLYRYRSFGTVDPLLLAESEGGRTEVRTTWSSVPTNAPVRSHGPLVPPRRPGRPGRVVTGQVALLAGPQRFELVPTRSKLVVDVRSTAGPITFSTFGLSGRIDVEIVDGAARPGYPAVAHVEIPVEGLRSGDVLYDAELLRHIEGRRHRTALLDVTATTPRSAEHHRIAAQLTFHGVTRTVDGTVNAQLADGNVLVVTSEHTFDIRDFYVAAPTDQIFRIFADTRFRLHLEAEPSPNM